MIGSEDGEEVDTVISTRRDVDLHKDGEVGGGEEVEERHADIGARYAKSSGNVCAKIVLADANGGS